MDREREKPLENYLKRVLPLSPPPLFRESIDRTREPSSFQFSLPKIMGAGITMTIPDNDARITNKNKTIIERQGGRRGGISSSIGGHRRQESRCLLDNVIDPRYRTRHALAWRRWSPCMRKCTRLALYCTTLVNRTRVVHRGRERAMMILAPLNSILEELRELRGWMKKSRGDRIAGSSFFVSKSKEERRVRQRMERYIKGGV